MTDTTQVTIPDIGDFDEVEVIEVLVSTGDVVATEDPIITLESDKATMEIPSPVSGTVASITVAVGDRVSEGAAVAEITGAEEQSPPDTSETAPVEDQNDAESVAPAPAQPQPSPEQSENQPPSSSQSSPQSPPPDPPAQSPDAAATLPHASPAIRRFARELGADLNVITGSGRKGRILKEDVKNWIKQQLTETPSGARQGTFGIPAIAEIDFSEFGDIETIKLTRIKKLSGPHLQRAWLNIPHVTHHDEADITEIEAFRQSLKKEAESKGIRITLLSFAIKALVGALKEYPNFNASLAADGERLILKHYYNIGIAIDTPDGLVVPVIREVDRKSIFDLAQELSDVSERARNNRLKPEDLKGGCISISSLGGIGGVAFTPIVNAPEVAILGISRAKMMPVWDGQDFAPRLMLPLSLSYDHRVTDGAEAARFSAYLVRSFSDVRRLSL